MQILHSISQLLFVLAYQSENKGGGGISPCLNTSSLAYFQAWHSCYSSLIFSNILCSSWRLFHCTSLVVYRLYFWMKICIVIIRIFPIAHTRKKLLHTLTAVLVNTWISLTWSSFENKCSDLFHRLSFNWLSIVIQLMCYKHALGVKYCQLGLNSIA